MACALISPVLLCLIKIIYTLKTFVHGKKKWYINGASPRRQNVFPAVFAELGGAVLLMADFND